METKLLAAISRIRFHLDIMFLKTELLLHSLHVCASQPCLPQHTQRLGRCQPEASPG